MTSPTDDLAMTENWKQINNYPYSISDLGRIKNWKGKILKQPLVHKYPTEPRVDFIAALVNWFRANKDHLLADFEE